MHYIICYLRNRKHVPCFYQVIETWVEVWEKVNAGNMNRRRVFFPQLFWVLRNFHECFFNSIETQSTCFLFLVENTTTRKGKQLVNFDYENVNSRWSPHHYVNRFWLHSHETFNVKSLLRMSQSAMSRAIQCILMYPNMYYLFICLPHEISWKFQEFRNCTTPDTKNH